MIVAGLTGGIASGKSTVAGFLREAGAEVIDADQIAREVVRPGTSAHTEIIRVYGREMLQPDGQIDRKRLGDIIFNDPPQKARLNAIVHPHVFVRLTAAVDRIAERSPDAVVILDIPLLLETGWHGDLAEIIVVYVPQEVQLKRLMARCCRRLKTASAWDRLASMAPLLSMTIVARRRFSSMGIWERIRAMADCLSMPSRFMSRSN